MTLDELLEGVELPAVVRVDAWDAEEAWTVYYKAAGHYYGKFTSGGPGCYAGYTEGFEFPTKPKIILYRGMNTSGGGQWYRTRKAVPESWDYVQTIEVEDRTNLEGSI